MLLSCLVGGDKVDKGHIWVLGGKPRTKSSKTLTKYIGYMPQVLYTNYSLLQRKVNNYYGRYTILYVPMSNNTIVL